MLGPACSFLYDPRHVSPSGSEVFMGASGVWQSLLGSSEAELSRSRSLEEVSSPISHGAVGVYLNDGSH